MIQVSVPSNLRDTQGFSVVIAAVDRALWPAFSREFEPTNNRQRNSRECLRPKVPQPLAGKIPKRFHLETAA